MGMNPRLLRPTASGFDPRKIAGLEAWWDAADSASVTLDSGRVAEWRDKSGKGWHAANSTSGSTQPDYITAGQNGRNLVRFVAASSQHLSVNSASAFNFLHNGTTSYVAAVVSFGTTANPLAFYALCGNANGGQFSRGTLIGYDDRSGTSDRLWVSVANGSAVIVSANNSSYNDTFPAQQKVVFDALLDAGNATASQRLRARRDGGGEIAANTSTGTPSSDNAAGNFFLGATIGTAPNPGLFMQGDICELLLFSQHPTAAAQDSIRRYLANKWGITLAPQVSNADAQDWVNRVYANGGSVSTSTANAVNTFCDAIDAAGIRSKFRRLNLFAGSSLSACLVPLYRGESRTGTQYGGTTDANPGAGPFVSGDYTETGASGGLLGNDSSKHLNTDFRTQDLPGVNDCHIAVWSREATVTETRRAIGAIGGSSDVYIIDRRLTPGGGNSVRLGGGTNYGTGTEDFTAQSLIASRTSSTSAVLYKNGTSVATQTTTLSGVTLTTQVFGVFTGLQSGTTLNGFFPHRLCGYSIGAGLSAGEATSFHNAWAAFQTALGRGL